MYTVDVKVKGVSPLLQHRFPMPEMDERVKGAKKRTGSVDYTQEWRQFMYVSKNGKVYQPAVHFEAAMIKAAVNFKIQGKGNKTYKDLFKATVFVSPDEILTGHDKPEQLDFDADKPLYLDVRPVVVSRSRVVRTRPAFAAGWEFSFQLQVIDDQVAAELVNEVLALAGKTVGIGDYRPRFGRFYVTQFEVNA